MRFFYFVAHKKPCQEANYKSAPKFLYILNKIKKQAYKKNNKKQCNNTGYTAMSNTLFRVGFAQGQITICICAYLEESGDNIEIHNYLSPLPSWNIEYRKHPAGMAQNCI